VYENDEAHLATADFPNATHLLSALALVPSPVPLQPGQVAWSICVKRSGSDHFSAPFFVIQAQV
jgi:hypothetical protein